MLNFSYRPVVGLFSLSVVLVVGLTGCTSLKIPDAKTPPAVAHQETALKFEAALAKKIFPEKNGSGALKVAAGEGKGSSYTFTRTFKDKHWVVDRKGHYIGYYHIDAKGQVVLDREDDLEEGVRVDYTPGIVVLPGKLTDKPPYPKGTVKMKVSYLKSGKERTQGSCSYTIDSIKKVNLKTPAGTFETYLVRSSRKLNLSLAKVHLVIVQGYSPDKGLVLEEVWQKMRAVGIFGSDSHSRIVRAK